MLLLGTKSHNVFNPGAVVPAAIEDDDLAGGGKMRHVTLKEYLRFFRSEGAGNATTRNTRGLTRSVIALMVPPLPAASRPSNTMMTRNPLCFTQPCSRQSSTCSLRSSFS